MDAIERDLLLKIADLHGVPEGAYNIRDNGESAGRASTANIEIVSKTDGKSGIDIFVKPGTKNESVHIPVVLSKAGFQEVVYNDFHIGADADVVIVAGCGIHNCGGVDMTSRHDGIHTFYVGENARVKDVERHYGEGDGNGKNIMNPALCARVFLTLAWPSHMALFTTPLRDKLSPFSVTLVDVTASATPLQTLKSGALPQQSLLDLFLGNMGGCLGEVSALLLLAGGVYLLIRRVITWHTPVAFLGTVAVLCYVFPRGNADRLDFMLAELLCGGLILGAVYMATDYATTPLTPMGRILFGVGCGAITVLIRYFGTYPEGVSFAILIMNTFVYYLEKATKPRKFGGRTHGKKV